MLNMDKRTIGKRGWEFIDRWVELFFFMMLIVGFVVSILIGSAFFSYVVIFLFGLMAGRFLYLRKSMFPFYLITLGLLIGYTLGTRYGSWKVILLMFIIGTSISWYLHRKEIIR